jgi:hypothetical protein
MGYRHASTLAMVLLIAASSALVSLAADETPAKTGTLVGTVQDDTGKPAANCVVTIAPNAQKMRIPMDATTDKDGKFKIEKVPEGDWNLNVRSLRDVKLRALKSLTIDPDKTTDIGVLKLKRT